MGVLNKISQRKCTNTRHHFCSSSRYRQMEYTVLKLNKQTKHSGRNKDVQIESTVLQMQITKFTTANNG